MKTLRIIAFVAVADGLLVLAALLLVAGYGWQAAAVGVGTLAVVALAAWLCRSKPEPEAAPEWTVLDEPLPDDLSPTEEQMLRGPYWDPTLVFPDAVDDHAAQMIRALSGQTAVLPTLPEQHLLQPRRPGPHRQ